jgi:xylulokinase
MQTELLLGVDIGTSESKGVLVDLAGRPVAVEIVKHGVETPHPGWFEQDPEEVWWGDFIRLTKALIDTTGVSPGQIVCVAVSGLGQALAPTDAHGNPVRPKAILYGIDTRASVEIEEENDILGYEHIFEVTANVLTSQAIGPKILWLRKNEPEVYARATMFTTTSSYLVAKLTGNFCLDHHQACFWVPLYDFHRLRWHEEFCSGTVRIDQLPALMWPTDIAGRVTAASARVTGLRQGTPVTAGGGDAFAEMISAGVVRENSVMVMYGSTAAVYMQAPSPVADKRLWNYHSYRPGLDGVAACTSTSGALTQWFRDEISRDLLAEEQRGGSSAYSRLVEEAAAVPAGADGVIVLPYFSGERSPIFDPGARGIIFGLTLTHRRAHLCRAVLEGIGYSVRHILEVMHANELVPEQVVAIGGGTKNRVWVQAVSDICNVAQQVPSITIGAAYGDALLAAVAIGALPSVEDATRWVSYAQVVEPRSVNREVYARGYATYRELYERTKDLMHSMNVSTFEGAEVE